jgi:hypothetical protein
MVCQTRQRTLHILCGGVNSSLVCGVIRLPEETLADREKVTLEGRRYVGTEPAEPSQRILNWRQVALLTFCVRRIVPQPGSDKLKPLPKNLRSESLVRPAHRQCCLYHVPIRGLPRSFDFDIHRRSS